MDMQKHFKVMRSRLFPLCFETTPNATQCTPNARLLTQDLRGTTILRNHKPIFLTSISWHVYSSFRPPFKEKRSLSSNSSPEATNDDVFFHDKARTKSKIQAYMHFLQDLRCINIMHL